MQTITLSPAEIAEITSFTQPCKQLEVLHERGFSRAYRRRATGEIILERAHYLAVCTGQYNIGKTTANFVDVGHFNKGK
jgi:hypothetical protein